jgi:hypothetical protein
VCVCVCVCVSVCICVNVRLHCACVFLDFEWLLQRRSFRVATLTPSHNLTSSHLTAQEIDHRNDDHQPHSAGIRNVPRSRFRRRRRVPPVVAVDEVVVGGVVEHEHEVCAVRRRALASVRLAPTPRCD